jgi:hypothetical protein
MPYDVNGNFTVVAGTIVNTGDTVLPSQHNPMALDFASGLSLAYVRDGRAALTGDMDAGEFRIRNIADGTLPGDTVNFGQLPAAVTAVLPTLKATNAQVYAATSNRIFTTDLIASASVPVALTEGSPVPLNWAAGITRFMTATADRQIQNPTNVQPGTQRIIRFIGNSATNRTLTWDTRYRGPFPIGDLNSTNGFIVTLWAYTENEIHVFWKMFTV